MSRKPRTTTPSIIGANLRRIRTEHGLTQLELAERTGTADGTISRLERGRLDPSASLVEKLAEGLRVSAQDLMSSKAATKPSKQRASVARLVALTDGLSDAQVDDLTKGLKLLLAVGRSSARQ
jgi:transcriptional regulator with XRE-family HTH domain